MNDATPADPLALHRGLLTLDTHIDIPWPTGPDPFLDGTRRVDLPKMQRGGLAAGCFVAYVPQAARTAESEAAAFERAHRHAASRSAAWGAARTASSRASPSPPMKSLAAKRDGELAIIPAVENGFAMGTDLSRLARFRALGARYLTLTHNGHNALADSCNPRTDLGDAPTEHGGLSPLGRAAIAELNRLGMLVDVAHVSRDTMLQAAEVSRTPVVSTHSCIRALCDHPRNMDDAQLDVLRDTGGVIQITAVAAFLQPRREARGGHRRRLRRPYRLRGAAHRHRAMSASPRILTAAAASPAGTTPRRARTSRRNCCGAATTGRRSPRSGAAISCACCGLPRKVAD